MEIYKVTKTSKGIVLSDFDSNKVMDVDTKIVRLSVRRKAVAAGQVIVVMNDGKVARKHPNAVPALKAEGLEDMKKSYHGERANQDPSAMFANLENLTKMVARGIQPSLIVSGMSGMGKTYLVKKTLNSFPTNYSESGHLEEGKDYIHIKGRASASGVYATLYNYSDKIVIFDDCDTVLQYQDAVNLLKGALDSYDTRKLSYISQKPLKDEEGNKIPSSFEFTGKVIFITNKAQKDIDDALVSRSFITDISMNINQMFNRIEELMESVEPKLPLKSKVEALSILKDLYKEYQGVDVNMRTFIKAARICAMGIPNAKQMCAEQICRA